MEEQLEGILKCAICLDRFVQPKMLPCQHTFCLTPCLQNLVVRNRITCPHCRRRHKVPEEGLVNLPNNLAIGSMLDIRNEPNEPPVQACLECMKGCENPQLCQHCGKGLCEECFKVHTQQIIRGLMDLVKEVHSAVPVISNVKTNFKERQVKLKSNGESIKRDISAAINECIHQLNTRHQSLLAQVDSCVSFQLRKLKSEQEKIEKELPNIREHCKHAKTKCCSYLEGLQDQTLQIEVISLILQSREYLRNIKLIKSNIEDKITSSIKFQNKKERRILSEMADFGEVIHTPNNYSNWTPVPSAQSVPRPPSPNRSGIPTMGFMKHAVLLTSIIILAYLIHRPTPHDVPERGKVKLLKDVISFLELLGSISNKVGYSRWWSIRLEPGLVPTPNGTKVEHQHFEGVDCLIVTPKSFQKRTEPGPAIVYYHGGGWVTGSISMYKSLLIDLAEETGFLVMSPEYRKAPEHPFPTPYYDCLISTISFMTLSQQLNVHPNKIVLAGDGAGGNLAMAVYLGLLQMDSSTIQLPAMQVVIYPMLQMINFQTPSYSHSKDYLFPNNMIQKFWLAYIGLDHRHDLAEIIARNGHFDKSDKNFSEKWKMVSHDNIPDKYKQQREYVSMDDTKYELPYEVRDHVKSMMLDTRIAPLLASDDIVKRIKKTLVLVCEYDPLRDDGILLYQRIKSLKGKVELQYLPTSLHGATTLGAALKNSYYSEQNNILFRAIRDGIEEESVLEEESVMFNNFFFFP